MLYRLSRLLFTTDMDLGYHMKKSTFHAHCLRGSRLYKPCPGYLLRSHGIYVMSPRAHEPTLRDGPAAPVHESSHTLKALFAEVCKAVQILAGQRVIKPQGAPL